MAILDRVEQMKKQGLSEQEISNVLQEEGIAPKAITDALVQSKIKQTVQKETTMEETYDPNMPVQQNQDVYSQDSYAFQQHPMQYAQEEYPQQQGYYPQEGYEQGYSGGGGTGTDTIMEIAEQVFEEKIKNIRKEMDSLKEFATLAGAKISDFGERIKKIESIIDTLQIKILEKIGSYGQGLDTIKKEMNMMQDTFTKMVPDLAKRQLASEKPISKKRVLKK